MNLIQRVRALTASFLSVEGQHVILWEGEMVRFPVASQRYPDLPLGSLLDADPGSVGLEWSLGFYIVRGFQVILMLLVHKPHFE